MPGSVPSRRSGSATNRSFMSEESSAHVAVVKQQHINHLLQDRTHYERLLQDLIQSEVKCAQILAGVVGEGALPPAAVRIARRRPRGAVSDFGMDPRAQQADASDTSSVCSTAAVDPLEVSASTIDAVGHFLDPLELPMHSEMNEYDRHRSATVGSSSAIADTGNFAYLNATVMRKMPMAVVAAEQLMNLLVDVVLRYAGGSALIVPPCGKCGHRTVIGGQPPGGASAAAGSVTNDGVAAASAGDAKPDSGNGIATPFLVNLVESEEMIRQAIAFEASAGIATFSARLTATLLEDRQKQQLKKVEEEHRVNQRASTPRRVVLPPVYERPSTPQRTQHLTFSPARQPSPREVLVSSRPVEQLPAAVSPGRMKIRWERVEPVSVPRISSRQASVERQPTPAASESRSESQGSESPMRVHDTTGRSNADPSKSSRKGPEPRKAIAKPQQSPRPQPQTKPQPTPEEGAVSSPATSNLSFDVSAADEFVPGPQNLRVDQAHDDNLVVVTDGTESVIVVPDESEGGVAETSSDEEAPTAEPSPAGKIPQPSAAPAATHQHRSPRSASQRSHSAGSQLSGAPSSSIATENSSVVSKLHPRQRSVYLGLELAAAKSALVRSPGEHYLTDEQEASRSPQRLQIIAVHRYGPAADLGIEAGDILLAVDGATIADHRALERLVLNRLERQPPGKEVSLLLERRKPGSGRVEHITKWMVPEQRATPPEASYSRSPSAGTQRSPSTRTVPSPTFSHQQAAPAEVRPIAEARQPLPRARISGDSPARGPLASKRQAGRPAPPTQGTRDQRAEAHSSRFSPQEQRERKLKMPVATRVSRGNYFEYTFSGSDTDGTASEFDVPQQQPEPHPSSIAVAPEVAPVAVHTESHIVSPMRQTPIRQQSVASTQDRGYTPRTSSPSLIQQLQRTLGALESPSREPSPAAQQHHRAGYHRSASDSFDPRYGGIANVPPQLGLDARVEPSVVVNHSTTTPVRQPARPLSMWERLHSGMSGTPPQALPRTPSQQRQRSPQMPPSPAHESFRSSPVLARSPSRFSNSPSASSNIPHERSGSSLSYFDSEDGYRRRKPAWK